MATRIFCRDAYGPQEVKAILTSAFVLDSVFQIIVWSCATENFVSDKMVLSILYFLFFMLSLVGGCRF